MRVSGSSFGLRERQPFIPKRGAPMNWERRLEQMTALAQARLEEQETAERRAKAKKSQQYTPPIERNPKNPIAMFEVGGIGKGRVFVELFQDKMPLTVSNFIDLAKNKFYDGLHFHRVIPGFMDQFGCPFTKDAESPKAGTGGPEPGTSFINVATNQTVTRDAKDGSIPDEFTAKYSNEPGTLSMANSGHPNSGGSQFFLNVAHNNYLDWFDDSSNAKHPVFGQIVRNYPALVKISEQPTNQDRPLKPIVMKSVTIMSFNDYQRFRQRKEWGRVLQRTKRLDMAAKAKDSPEAKDIMKAREDVKNKHPKIFARLLQEEKMLKLMQQKAPKEYQAVTAILKKDTDEKIARREKRRQRQASKAAAMAGTMPAKTPVAKMA